MSKRLVYIIPQHHFNLKEKDMENMSQRFPNINFLSIDTIKKWHVAGYRKYARDIRERLRKDHIQPRDCYLYLEHFGATLPVESVRKILLGREYPQEFPNELDNTLAVSLIKKGAIPNGCDDELVDDANFTSPEGVQRRDSAIKGHVLNTLPVNKVGIIIIGEAHFADNNLGDMVEVRTTRDLFDAYYKKYYSIDQLIKREEKNILSRLVEGSKTALRFRERK